MGEYHLEDECWDEAWENKNKTDKLNVLNEEYRRACKQEMMNDLIKEFDKLLVDETISGKMKNMAFRMVMDILKSAQMKS